MTIISTRELSNVSHARFDSWMTAESVAIEAELDLLLPTRGPAGLHRMMRYAALGGGKRLRPLIVLASASAVQGSRSAALRAACAIELMHAASLVHDDLPCMDNDDLRRGRPTTHAVFGAAQAVVVGDALQSLAFELLTPPSGIDPATQGRLCAILARAAGCAGMAGGQAIDIECTGKQVDLPTLCDMHARKTGALLRGSVLLGAACGTPGQRASRALGAYGDAIGLAFQIVDDILDTTQDTATLGKTAGKDAAMSKATYVTVLGLEQARARVCEEHRRARRVLSRSGLEDTELLSRLTEKIVHRIK